MGIQSIRQKHWFQVLYFALRILWHLFTHTRAWQPYSYPNIKGVWSQRDLLVLSWNQQEWWVACDLFKHFSTAYICFIDLCPTIYLQSMDQIISYIFIHWQTEYPKNRLFTLDTLSLNIGAPMSFYIKPLDTHHTVKLRIRLR